MAVFSFGLHVQWSFSPPVFAACWMYSVISVLGVYAYPRLQGPFGEGFVAQ